MERDLVESLLTNLDEKIRSLGSGIKIIISNKISFTTDSVLLADFSSSAAKSKVLEIGSGCGIIPLLWCKNQEIGKITAVEIQKPAFDLMVKSIHLNGLEKKIFPINKDIKTLSQNSEFIGAFDSVVCNPPYLSSEKPCKISERTISRHEKTINIEEIIKLSYLFLNNGGYLYLCCRSERLCDVIFYMKQNKIEPKLLKFVEYLEGNPPKLFLIKGKKNANPGVIIENNLVLQTKNKNYSNEAKKIYKDF